MKAVSIEQYGGAENLAVREIENPETADEEVLIRVRAAGVNRADIMQRKGGYPPPPGASSVLGLEVSGTIEHVSAATAARWGFSKGDRVCALLPGGGYAEFTAADAGTVFPVPEGLDLVKAAAVPEAFLTAYHALHLLAGLEEGERVLIHAGASGVGTAAIQIARINGARVAVTAGSAEKCNACIEYGADIAVNYKEESFAEAIRGRNNGGGVDVIVDFVGANYFAANLAVLARDGRLVLLSLLSGSVVENIDISPILVKRIRIEGSTLRSRSPDYKRNLVRSFRERILPYFENGKIFPIIDSIYDWGDVADAHRHMEANKNIGKIVLTGMNG